MRGKKFLTWILSALCVSALSLGVACGEGETTGSGSETSSESSSAVNSLESSLEEIESSKEVIESSEEVIESSEEVIDSSEEVMESSEEIIKSSEEVESSEEVVESSEEIESSEETIESREEVESSEEIIESSEEAESSRVPETPVEPESSEEVIESSEEAMESSEEVIESSEEVIESSEEIESPEVHVCKAYEMQIVKYPTCTEKGTLTKRCIDCGESVQEDISSTGHAFAAWEEETPSTCKVPGKGKRTCGVCNFIESGDLPLAEHDFGDWVETKAATLTEEGEMTSTCSVCGEQQTSPIDKLYGYTVTVSGGTVNRAGETLEQSSIYVGEGEIVTIKAKDYAGYTFFQWYADHGDVIPTATFDLRVYRDTTFSICFKEPMAYGDWILERERKCEEDGRYYRVDANTGLKEYLIIPAYGYHEEFVERVLEEADCTKEGLSCEECVACGYQNTYKTGPLGHDFSGEYRIIEEAYGPKVGKKSISCTRCGETKTKEYIKAAYPQGDLKITYDSDNRQGVMSSDRDEIHWMLGEKEYCYYVMRDSSGHSSGNYLHFFFYYKDEGANSPVYIMKKIGDNTINSMTLRDQYGSYGWGLATYVDNFDEYMKFIDSNNGRSDNGLNSTSMYDMFRSWEQRFNEAGGIPNGFYLDGVTEYLGYQCRIWSNGNFYYYVNEDNCCLLYGGLGYNRQYENVTKIEEITEIPYAPELASVNYTTISIKYGDGNDGSFKDNNYFDIESIHDEVSIYESSYISKREKVAGWEVQLKDGSWVKIEGLTKSDGEWKYPDGDELRTYKRILNEYFDGNLEEIYIRAIRETAEMSVTVKAINAYIYQDSTEFGTENVFPGGDTVNVSPDYDFALYETEKWLITVNGVTTESDYYQLTVELPENGTVIVECVLKEVSTHYVTINVVGPGKVSETSGNFPEGTALELFATPNPGKVFVGWYVVGLYNMGGDEMPELMSVEPIDEGDFADYSQYGEFFSDKYRYVFRIEWPDEAVVITAVFEDYRETTNYMDVTIEGGFLVGNNRMSVQVTSLRLYAEDYVSFFAKDYERVIGWGITEDQNGTPVTTTLEDSWGGHWIMYNTQVKANYQA